MGNAVKYGVRPGWYTSRGSAHSISPPVHSQPPRPNEKPWATNTANLRKPKSRTSFVRGLCPNITHVLDSSSCGDNAWEEHVTFALLKHCRQQPLPEEQPGSHTAADQHHLSLLTQSICDLVFDQSSTTRTMPNATCGR